MPMQCRSRMADGVPQSGFGYISYKDSGLANPRNGMVVVRLEF